jgi:hypothetical protein
MSRRAVPPQQIARVISNSDYTAILARRIAANIAKLSDLLN